MAKQPPPKQKQWTVETEYSAHFQERMRAAMAVSFHKYGPVANAYPHKVNAIASLLKRLKIYQETGNADYLVDVANYAMIEFMHPAHESYHDQPTDGGEGRVWHSGGPPTEKRNDGGKLPDAPMLPDSQSGNRGSTPLGGNRAR